MGKLQEIVFHSTDGDENDGLRSLEMQFSSNLDRLYISIIWPEKDSVWLGPGMRAESFTLSAEEARRVAKDILENIPDPMILEDNLAAIQG